MDEKFKLFISYSDKDVKKVKLIRTLLVNNPTFEPIIIASDNTPLQPLADKVKKGIERSHFVIPILTPNSISTQWINQEIGYATGKKIEIRPIVEQSQLEILKGFIHKNLDLPYSYKQHVKLAQEQKNFKIAFFKLLVDLEYRVKEIALKKASRKKVKNTVSDIHYISWDNKNYTAKLGDLICYWSNDIKPKLVRVEVPNISHTSAENQHSHSSNFMNYLSDNREQWRADIKAEFDEDGNVSFYILHTSNNTKKSHPSANINYLDWNGKLCGAVIKSMKVDKNGNKAMSFDSL